MIIFVEGADGSGKSTLVKQLSDAGYKTYRIQSDKNEIWEWLRITGEKRGTIIFDRVSFISDLVYRLCDKKERYGMSLPEISAVMSCSDIAIIYCKTDTSFDDAIERGEDLITTKEHHDKICNIYDIIIDMFKIFSDVKVMEYNWTKQCLQDVIKFIEKEERNAVR